MKFKKLFSPLKVGRLTLKNRIVTAPMSIVELDAKGGYTDKEAERNILSNPFKRFEDMNMMRHTKTLGIIEVDGTVWKKLSEDEKKRIEEICAEKLDGYYAKLNCDIRKK